MSSILIVDDDFTIKLELEEMLTAIGYDIVGTAENGEQAVQMAQGLNPDLILMDIVMPGHMDGISAAKKIRQESNIPIVFITGYGDPEYIERAKVVEPYGYVMKPFDEKEISAVVEIALYKRKMELKLKGAQEQLEQRNHDLQMEIRERKKSQEALKASQQHLSQIIDFLPDATMVIDLDGKVTAWNRAIEDMTGIKAKDILGKGNYEYAIPFHGERRPILIDLVTQWDEETAQKYPYVKKQGEALVFETYDSKVKPGGFLRNKASLLYDSAGKATGAIESIRDISERKAAEKALGESEERLRMIAENTSSTIAVLDNRGTYEFVNPAHRVLGYEPAELMGTSGFNLIHPNDAPRLTEILQKGLNGKLSRITTEYRARHKDGRTVLMEGTFDSIRNKSGDLEKIVFVGDDITDRKQIEAALKESEKKFRRLFDTSPNAIAVTEIKTGKLIDVNDQFCRLTKTTRDETLGRTTTELGFYSEDDRNRFINELENSGKVDGFEIGFKREDGVALQARLFAVPVQIEGEAFLLTEFHNITEEKRLEAQLLQARKMEATSTLTGGIAHDYNNLMSIVMGNLSLAMEEVEAGSLSADFLREANAAALKVRDLTHELMVLSKGGEPVKEVGPLDELLKSALDTIPADSRISLSEAISEDLWQVPHDPYKTGAVFRNVITNAVEAMPGGGTLTIKAENLAVEDKDQYPVPLNPGNYVRISIQDQGVGIREELLENIFDPYFSTKEMGVSKGMGLGLATAYAIVKKHGGHLAIDSTPGVGTSVKIYLPAENHRAQMDHTITSVTNKTSPVKRVLVMDDEDMLRDLAEKMLERLGYATETVKDGFEAIESYQKGRDSGEPFDAVILDLTIKGGMGGEKTISELLKIDPHVKAIVCSGYFNDPVMSDFKKYGFKGALPKPYQKKNLKEVLETLFA